MPPALPDSDLLDRWLGILGLIDAADNFAARRTGPWAGLAVVAADAAMEAALGLVATGGPKPPDGQERYADLLGLAEVAFNEVGTPLSARLRERMVRTHRARNSALHVGAEPGERTVQAALGAARELLAIAAATSPLLEQISRVGPVQAVAELVDVFSIREALLVAAEALGQGDLVRAADSAAIAFNGALERLDPPLRARATMPRGKLQLVSSYGPQRPIGIDEIIEPHEKRADLAEAWLLALAIGLRPNEVADLHRVLGHVVGFLDGRIEVRRAPEIALTPALVESSLLTVASVVFRLVANGELRLREPWEKA
ncbi:MAG: hypothetical protein ACHQ01_10920 [Candidatus Limnocylindrales bacterium]